MKKVTRDEILFTEAYKREQKKIRESVFRVKEDRRIHLGPLFTFLFENRETIKYQIQEMVRVESLTKEDAIKHEIDTYNQLLPKEKELTATLLIEIDDPDHRRVKLKELLGLDKHISFRIDQDIAIQGDFDDKQFDTERLSSVQFIRFRFEENTRSFLNSNVTELVSSHPYYSQSQILNRKQLQALKEDLSQE